MKEDTGIVPLRQPNSVEDPLTEIAREGARRMLYDLARGKDVGAMEDYGVGDTFSATEPVEFGLFYRDHPNYPLDEDWLMLQELEANQKVTFDFVTGLNSRYRRSPRLALRK